MLPNIDSRVAVRVHDFLPVSEANGPGQRAVIWFQGCNQRCPGCFNPQTHSHQGGSIVMVKEITEWVKNLYERQRITGFTISGGEPFLQAHGLRALLNEIRCAVPDLSVLLFTGFEWRRLAANRSYQEMLCMGLVDILVAGPYEQSLALGKGLRGSDNQTVHMLTDRHSLDEMDGVPAGEIVVSATGVLTVSGLHSLTASMTATLESLGVAISEQNQPSGQSHA